MAEGGQRRDPKSHRTKAQTKRHISGYQATTKEKKKRASRNKARRVMKKAGRVRKGDGKEVDHKDGNARNNKRSNLRIMSRRANRKKG
jgi:hypothetical protein